MQWSDKGGVLSMIVCGINVHAEVTVWLNPILLVEYDYMYGID